MLRDEGSPYRVIYYGNGDVALPSQQQQQQQQQRQLRTEAPSSPSSLPLPRSATLYHKDCISGLNNNITKGSIDVVVTSPPYNIGVNYGSYSDRLPRQEYLAWMEDVGIAIKKALADDGSFFLNVGNRPKDQWIAWDVASVMRKHYMLQNVIMWVKSIAICKEDMGRQNNNNKKKKKRRHSSRRQEGISIENTDDDAASIIDPGTTASNNSGDIAVGHFKPVVSERFLNDCYEYIFHFTKDGERKLDKLAVGIPYQDKSNIGRWKGARQDLRDRGNTWFIPYETIQSREERPHPATFPVKLPEMCIRLHGRDAKLVADPFTGIGSTAVAAKRLGISFVGFEVDKNYLDEAIDRLLHVPDAAVATSKNGINNNNNNINNNDSTTSTTL